jgi:hypothetical protein
MLKPPVPGALQIERVRPLVGNEAVTFPGACSPAKLSGCFVKLHRGAALGALDRGSQSGQAASDNHDL